MFGKEFRETFLVMEDVYAPHLRQDKRNRKRGYWSEKQFEMLSLLCRFVASSSSKSSLETVSLLTALSKSASGRRAWWLSGKLFTKITRSQRDQEERVQRAKYRTLDTHEDTRNSWTFAKKRQQSVSREQYSSLFPFIGLIVTKFRSQRETWKEDKARYLKRMKSVKNPRTVCKDDSFRWRNWMRKWGSSLYYLSREVIRLLYLREFSSPNRIEWHTNPLAFVLILFSHDNVCTVFLRLDERTKKTIYNDNFVCVCRLSIFMLPLQAPFFTTWHVFTPLLLWTVDPDCKTQEVIEDAFFFETVMVLSLSFRFTFLLLLPKIVMRMTINSILAASEAVTHLLSRP